MKHLYVILLFFCTNACVNPNPVLIRDAPNARYELIKVEELLVSNFAMLLFKQPYGDDNNLELKKLKFKIFIQNSSKTNAYELAINESKLINEKVSFAAACKFDPEKQGSSIQALEKVFVFCDVDFKKSDLLNIKNNDLIAELNIPLKSNLSKVIKTRIYVRNEDLINE